MSLLGIQHAHIKNYFCICLQNESGRGSQKENGAKMRRMKKVAENCILKRAPSSWIWHFSRPL